MKEPEILKILNTEVDKLFKEFLAVFKNNKKKSLSRKKDSLKLTQHYLLSLVAAFFVFGFLGGALALVLFPEQAAQWLPRLEEKIGFWKEQGKNEARELSQKLEKLTPSGYQPQTSQERAIIEVVKKASPSVVSIIITKEVPIYETYYEKPFEDFFGGPLEIEIEVPGLRQKGTEKKKVGGGTGFIVSAEGLIITNKHVVADDEADYTVVSSEGARYEASLVDRDPLQDLAFLKIEAEKEVAQNGHLLEKKFPVLKLGEAADLQIGQTVVAIGNALGEFRNTVSVGIISGLGRRVVASGGGLTETLEDVIQTDAAINEGNSGGPLLNLKSEVIGVNVAKAEGAQSIGFSIPVNEAKTALLSIQKNGRILRPLLGVVYTLVNPELQEEKDLKVDYGALIVKEDGKISVLPDSAADKAGLKPGDIILEVNGQKITLQNTLAKMIKNYLPQETIALKVMRGEEVFETEAVLGEVSSDNPL